MYASGTMYGGVSVGCQMSRSVVGACMLGYVPMLGIPIYGTVESRMNRPFAQSRQVAATPFRCTTRAR